MTDLSLFNDRKEYIMLHQSHLVRTYVLDSRVYTFITLEGFRYDCIFSLISLINGSLVTSTWCASQYWRHMAEAKLS